MAVDAPRPSGGAVFAGRIANELGIGPESLRKWVRQAEIDRGQRPGTTSDEARRISELERENRELRRANEIFKSASALFKAELINRRGPWRSVEDVEAATARWVHWWNSQRLHGACGDIPPAEYEAAYWATQQVATAA